MNLKEFIEVTSLIDRKRFCIRAECIVAVYENDEVELNYGRKPACCTIVYGNDTIDVAESYDEICAKIYNAEL